MISQVITFCVVTFCVKKVITFCVGKLLHFALNTLLHYASMLLRFASVLHFAAIVITFCVSITFCDDYYTLRRNTRALTTAWLSIKQAEFIVKDQIKVSH